jgi:DGQHR domain-containing protein
MTDNTYIEVPAVSYAQPGAAFYACVVRAQDIVGRLEIRRRSQDPNAGLQRDENRQRVRDVAKYARERNAVFPTPIIVSASSEIVRLRGGMLCIPRSGGIIGHVLDGQHRLLGLRELTADELGEFDLLVVFAFDIDTYSEATIFSTINGTQRQVSKSLMYDLFSLKDGRSVEKTCHEIVRSLNDDDKSPFYRRIKLLGKKVSETETLSQAAFVDQIARQVRTCGILKRYFDAGEDWVIRKLVSNCFAAIQTAQHRTPASFPEDYFFRTTGFGGVAQSLGDLVRAGAERKDMSESWFLDVMERYLKANTTPPDGVGNAAMLAVKEGIVRAISDVSEKCGASSS